jgi:hypothetical protein
MSFFSCNSQTRNSTNIPVNIDAVETTDLPFSFDKNSVQFDSLKNQEINVLFVDSTVLFPPFLYTDHPNNIQGRFYRRLPNVGSYRVLLFIYFNTEWLSDGMNKSTTVELQVFNINNQIVDKMIIADGVEGDCSWHRSFEIGRDYYVNIKNRFSCFETNDTIELNQVFKINENGNIVEIFQQNKGDLEFCEKIPFLDKIWYSRGYVENHLKQGKWIECEYIFDLNIEEYKNEYLWNTYSNGIKISKPIVVEDCVLDEIDCLNEEK